MRRPTILLTCILGILLLWVVLRSLSTAAADPYQSHVAAQIQLQEHQLSMEQARASFSTNQLLFTIAALAIIGTLAIWGMGSGLAYYQNQAEQRRRLEPDDNGLYPIDTKQLSREIAQQIALTFAGGAMQAAIERAKASAAVPSHLTYSPRMSDRAPALLSAPEEKGHTPAVVVPDFATLLDSGQVGRGQPLLLGYTDQGPLTGSLKSLYSSAVAGLPGSGKTTTIRFLAAQSALHGATFVLLDPHADAGEESLVGTLSALQSRFLCDPASNDKQMVATIALVTAKLQARLRGEQDRTPLIVAIDEFTALMRRSTLSEPLGQLIEAIAQEGRKVAVFCLAAGQIWTASGTGSTALRDSFASCYVHRLKRSQARMLVSTEDAREAEDLPTGHAILCRTNGESHVIAVPPTTASDIHNVARLLTMTSDEDMLTLPVKSARSHSEVVPDVTSSPSLSAEEVRIVELFRQGCDVAQIVREVYDIPSSGARYQRASTDVQGILRRGMEER